MPFDTYGSYLQGDIGDLDEYIQWVGNALNNTEVSMPPTEWEQKANEIGQKLLRELRRERESRQRQLEMHQQHDRERGIKY